MSVNPDNVITRTKIVKRDGEYIVRAYNAQGQRLPLSDYYTNDRADAEGTAALMVKIPESKNSAD